MRINDKLYKWLWYTSIPLIMVFATLQHYLYEWTNCPFIALWAPINESVWEHTKLCFYPLICWWLAMYFIFKNHRQLNFDKWFFSMSITCVVSIIGILSIYSTLIFGFSIKGTLPLHIVIQIISLILAQLIGAHLYRRIQSKQELLIVGLSIVIIIAVLYVIFNYYAPSVPLFVEQKG